jgi:hypothetical protein
MLCPRCGYRQGDSESSRPGACSECGYVSEEWRGPRQSSHLDPSWTARICHGSRLLRGALRAVPLFVLGLLFLGAAGSILRTFPLLNWLSVAIEPMRWIIVGGTACMAIVIWAGLLQLFAEDPFEDWLPIYTCVRGLNFVAPALLLLWVGFAEFDPGRIPAWALIPMTLLLAAHAVVVLAWCAKLGSRIQGGAHPGGMQFRIRPDAAIWTTLMASGVFIGFALARGEAHWFRATWITWFIAIAVASARLHRALLEGSSRGRRGLSASRAT